MNIPGYALKDPIGKGGMATAYLAVQESLGREVVLKIMNARYIQNKDMVERFLAEGRIVASLNHPHIITIYDIGIADDQLYISMEYVKGGDLKQRIQTGISVDQALDYLEQLSSGLQAAHQHDIVHRDIKPANILFRADGIPLITDFGIAKQTTLDSELTSTGMFLGSPNYVSPEQADGHRVDGRTDIYSLGCVLYEMLTGNKPFAFTSVIDIVIQHKQAPIPRLPEELAEFQPLLDRMMAKKPDERFPDTDSLLSAIHELRDQRQRRLQQLAGGKNEVADKKSIGRRGFASRLLIVLLLLSAGFFGTVLYVETRLNRAEDSPAAASTKTVLDESPAVRSGSINFNAGPAESGPNRQAIIRALAWLGQQSLEEYKLTYPPKDNAYYYFNKLLELDPGSELALQGINQIADRYAILAEQALAHDDIAKSRIYINLGLKIDAEHNTLLSLQSLVQQDEQEGLLSWLKNIFG